MSLLKYYMFGCRVRQPSALPSPLLPLLPLLPHGPAIRTPVILFLDKALMSSNTSSIGVTRQTA